MSSEEPLADDILTYVASKESPHVRIDLRRSQIMDTPESLAKASASSSGGGFKQPECDRFALEVGLDNIGATCYLNATIQALANLTSFRSYFTDQFLPEIEPSRAVVQLTPGKPNLRRRDTVECMRSLSERNLQPSENDVDIYLSLEIHKVFRVMHAARWKSARPYGLLRAVWKVAPQFSNYQQQDAQEFFSILRDGIHSELTTTLVHQNHAPQARPVEGAPAAVPSIVTSCFEGILETKVACSLCNALSVTLSRFMELTLAIPETSKCEPVNSCSLDECIELFQRPETVEYRCEKCGGSSESTKRTRILYLPQILVLCLKRFTFSRLGFPFKVKTRVRFPLRDHPFLALPISSPSDVYKLRSVISHHGRGIDRGHYTATLYTQKKHT